MEMMMAEAEQTDLTTLTVQLLSAYVSNNSVPSSELAELIATTRTALAGKSVPETPVEPEFAPAVSVRKSTASREHLLSLIDGKAYKSLKRHLSSHGLTPADYRARYNLPGDYPMVAPAYSEARRDVARRLGLGRRVAGVSSEPIVAPETGPIPDAAPVVQAREVDTASPASLSGGTENGTKAASRKPRAKRVAADASAVIPEVAASPKPRRSSKIKADAGAEPVAAPRKRGRKPKAIADAPAVKASGRRGRKAVAAEPVASEPAAVTSVGG